MILNPANYIIRHDAFPQQLVKRNSLPSKTNSDGSRFYTTPEGNVYPSMTTVLGSLDNQWLGDWKARVGETEAKKISGYATRRGKALHSLLEFYIEHGSLDLTGVMPDVRQMVKRVLPSLNSINTVVGVELQMYSDKLRLAGTADLVAYWDNKLSVIDFKNSKRAKQREDIEGYFAQCTGYATMFEERYNMPVEQIVVVMAIEDMPCKVFVERAKDHESYLNLAIDTYWIKNAAHTKTQAGMEVGQALDN